MQNRKIKSLTYCCCFPSEQKFGGINWNVRRDEMQIELVGMGTDDLWYLGATKSSYQWRKCRSTVSMKMIEISVSVGRLVKITDAHAFRNIFLSGSLPILFKNRLLSKFIWDLYITNLISRYSKVHGPLVLNTEVFSSICRWLSTVIVHTQSDDGG